MEKIDANQKGKKIKRKIQVGSVGLQLFSKQSISQTNCSIVPNFRTQMSN